MLLSKKHILNLARVLAAFVVMAGLFLPMQPVHAQNKDEVIRGIGATGQTGEGAESTVETVIREALGILSIIIGIAGVLFVLIGGFKYITAGGDSSQISSATRTILYALAGLVVAALAQVIVNFVFTRVPG